MSREYAMSSEMEKTGRRTLVGLVVSDKMDKTVVVRVTRKVKDARYGKYVNRQKRYSVHDEGNAYHVNDMVEIEECRPLSRTKRWRVIGKHGE